MALRAFKDFISKPIFLGWQDSLSHSDNRLTAVINFCSLLGMISMVFVGVNIYPFVGPLALWYAVPFTLGGLVLLFNGLHNILAARVVLILKINLIALFAALFFGKEFNGYLTFYLALFFSVSLFGKTKRHFMFASLALSFLGLPLVDFLTSFHLIPIRPVPPILLANPLPSLLIDTFFVSGIFVLGLAVDRWHSDSYERSLEQWNETLDRMVKERTAELVRAKEAAEQASLLKSQFLANISHELRIPMQGILGFTHLAQSRLEAQGAELPGPEVAQTAIRYLDQIEESSARLNGFLSRLFEITSSSATDLTLHPSKGNLKTILTTALARFENIKIQKNISVILDYEMGENIETDLTLLEKSLVGVLDNSFRYAKLETNILVHVFETPDLWCIEVENQGLGVPPEESEIIFEPFTQSSFTNKTTGGTGLGLYRARRYLHALGGDVVLISGQPESTVFKIEIPKKTDSSLLNKNSDFS